MPSQLSMRADGLHRADMCREVRRSSLLIDDSKAPFVFVRSEQETDASSEHQFMRLLDKGDAFVLITDQSRHDHHDETVEERKQRILFFKSVKSRMALLCKGMVVVEQGKPTPPPARLAAATAGKAFGFPIAFATDEDHAVATARGLLAAPAV